MKEATLSGLISAGESDEVEFKREFPKSVRSLAKEIAAFASSKGGFLFIGVSDDGSILGIERATDQQYRATLAARVEGICQSLIEPAISFRIHFPNVGGKVLLVVEVMKGSDVLYLADGRAYVRQNSTSRALSLAEMRDRLVRDELVRRIEALEARPGPEQTTAAAFAGQGELATMSLSDLRRLLGIQG